MRTCLFPVVLLAAALPAAGADLPKADFVVSPSGDDSAPGTAEAPFATLARAQAAVRQRVAAGPKADVTVLVRGGTYELAEPLAFGPEDSGTDKLSITYAAWPGEKPVLSGGRAVGPWNDGEGGRWTAEVAAAKQGEWRPRQLYVGGRRAVRARSPNVDAQPDCWQLTAVELSDDRKVMQLSLPAEHVGDWRHAADLEVMVAGNWAINRKRVQSIDPAQGTLTLLPPHRHGPRYIFPSKGRWCSVENALDLLDQPGEWYLDRAAGVLHYQPRSQEEMATARAVLPRLVRLIEVRGDPDRPVRNLHFRGLQFSHTDWQLPAGGYMGIQACHHGHNPATGLRWQRIPAAVRLTDAVGCRIEDCVLAHLGGCGIELADGCRQCVVQGNRVRDVSGNGVMVGGPNVEERVPVACRVADNWVHACGREFYGAIGIWVGFARGAAVTHNRVHDLPYSGISVGWQWNEEPTACRENLVAGNHVFDVMNRLCDGGCIYTLGFQPGTVIRGNHLHDVHRSLLAQGAPNNGMFIDQGSKGYLFEKNVIYNTAAELVRFNQCKEDWHTWRDNHFGPEPEVKKSGAAIIAAAGLEPAYRRRLGAPSP